MQCVIKGAFVPRCEGAFAVALPCASKATTPDAQPPQAGVVEDVFPAALMRSDLQKHFWSVAGRLQALQDTHGLS